MAISKRQTPTGKTRWVARYRDHAGKEHAKTFTTQKQAKAFLQEQQRALRRGEWVNEKTSPTLAEYWPTWAATATTPGTSVVRRQVGKNLGGKTKPTQRCSDERCTRIHAYRVSGKGPRGQEMRDKHAAGESYSALGREYDLTHRGVAMAIRRFEQHLGEVAELREEHDFELMPWEK